MWSFLQSVCVFLVLLWLIKKVTRSIEDAAKSSLTRVTIKFNTDNIIKDFFQKYSEDEKKKIEKVLKGKPFSYAIKRENFTATSLVFYRDGCLGVSLHDEIEIKFKGGDDYPIISIRLDGGNLKLELDENKYALKSTSIAKFPFAPIDAFLTKTQNLAELKSLPPFLTEHLNKFDFKVNNYIPDKSETFKAYGAEWISEDWEVMAEHNWNSFQSKYVTVSLIYFFFSSSELSPFDKDLLLSSRHYEKSEIDHSPILDKIRKLRGPK